MKIKGKIILNVTITLLIILCILSLLSDNKLLIVLSVFGSVILISGFRISQYFKRIKLVKEIEKNNLKYIKVRENNKGMIFFVIIITLNLLNTIKSRYDIYKIESINSSSDITVFLNSIDIYDKLLILAVSLLIILAILTIVQVLFNQPIISKNKVIFYDGLVYEIAEIDEIQYASSFISKNKKVIKVEEGLTSRKLIVNLKDFEKVKHILENKNKS